MTRCGIDPALPSTQDSALLQLLSCPLPISLCLFGVHFAHTFEEIILVRRTGLRPLGPAPLIRGTRCFRHGIDRAFAPFRDSKEFHDTLSFLRCQVEIASAGEGATSRIFAMANTSFTSKRSLRSKVLGNSPPANWIRSHWMDLM